MARLFVGNVSTKGSLQELKNLFTETGKIKFFGINNESGYMVYKIPFIIIHLLFTLIIKIKIKGI